MLLLVLDGTRVVKQPWEEKEQVSLLKLHTRSLGWDNGPGCHCGMHGPACIVPLQGYTVVETKGDEENTGKLKSFMVRGFNSCFFWRMAQRPVEQEHLGVQETPLQQHWKGRRCWPCVSLVCKTKGSSASTRNRKWSWLWDFSPWESVPGFCL